jgi:RHS repeat-associated protein
MYLYDLAGNLRYKGYRLVPRSSSGSGPTDFQQEANYYQADGKLRVFERHMGDLYQHSNDGPAFATKGVHEEYRYDALGRRVLVWARRGPLCAQEGCESTVQRFVWDGNQLVYETRGPGADSTSSSNLEKENPSGNGERQQPNAYGEVSYTHAGGIDRPLAVYRAGLGTFFPHANWRSLYDGATNPSGQIIPCEGAGVPCSDSPDLDWPGSTTSAFIGATPEPRVTPAEWAGSLVVEQADASGLLYRRNRYYDPSSGRFTQPDPIGLAGGLNVYGFANGDPVSYSDPFGLCPEEMRDEDGRCPGGLSVEEWGRVEQATYEMKFDSALEVLGALYAGRIQGFSEQSTAVGRVTPERPDIIQINRSYSSSDPGAYQGSVFEHPVLTLTLLEELRHTHQYQGMDLATRQAVTRSVGASARLEEDAKRYALDNYIPLNWIP